METRPRLDRQVAALLGTGRAEARSLIENGHVRVADTLMLKPGVKLSPEAAAQVQVTGGRRSYVSRGGDKLAAALHHFALSVEGCVCLDVGASTGGFTDCLLQHGAARVYAIDNGTGQLVQSLRQDPRVIHREQTDIRTLTPAFFNDASLQMVTVDVSFISLTKVLIPIAALLSAGARMVCLIKPQFEAGRAFINKQGVVRDPAVHRRVVAEICAFAESIGFTVQGVIPSPLAGGNKEFLSYCVKNTPITHTPNK